MQAYQPRMKPRFNRSNPLANIKHGPIKPVGAHGSLGVDNATTWKRASHQTMGELASLGKLSLREIRQALIKGRLTATAFKKVFWETINPRHPTKEQMTMINCFADVLI